MHPPVSTWLEDTIWKSGWWLRFNPLTNMKVNWDDDIPIWMGKCSKPPTRNRYRWFSESHHKTSGFLSLSRFMTPEGDQTYLQMIFLSMLWLETLDFQVFDLWDLINAINNLAGSITCWVINPANLPHTSGYRIGFACVLQTNKHCYLECQLSWTARDSSHIPTKSWWRHGDHGTSTKAGAQQYALLLGDLDDVADRQQTASQDVDDQGAPDLWLLLAGSYWDHFRDKTNLEIEWCAMETRADL